MDSITHVPSERWTVDSTKQLCLYSDSLLIDIEKTPTAGYLLVALQPRGHTPSLFDNSDFLQPFWILNHLRRPNVNDHVAIRASCHTHAGLPISVQPKLAVVISSNRRYMQRSDSMRFDLVLPKFFRLQALDTPSPKSKKSHPSSNHPKSAVGDDSQANGPSTEKCSRAWPNSSHRSCIVYLPQTRWYQKATISSSPMAFDARRRAGCSGSQASCADFRHLCFWKIGCIGFLSRFALHL